MTIGRKTGGRTKGTPNKKTQALRAKVEAAGRVSPLDYVLGVMWDVDAPAAMRFEAARAALPFLHPKLAAIEHSGPGGGPIQTEQRDLSLIERRRRVAAFILKIAGPPIGEGDPPPSDLIGDAVTACSHDKHGSQEVI